jgi:hypothetical protein
VHSSGLFGFFTRSIKNWLFDDGLSDSLTVMLPGVKTGTHGGSGGLGNSISI